MSAFPPARVAPTIQSATINPPRRSRIALLRASLLAVLALLLIGVAAPFVNAARWSGSIRSALEFSLGRQVAFERAHFTVFSGPGFSLENVTISEDPKFGSEPFAFVPTLEARLRLDKLLAGQIRFSSLRLVEPSLNLVRRDDGAWNIVQLMGLLGAPRRAVFSLFPSLEVSAGRVDFKFGKRKSTLYISESDLSIYPQRSGKLLIRFSGSPARTDRAGNGFGHFRGNVNWYVGPAANPNRLESDITLDPSNLSELTTLIQGHDAGVHGTVSSRLRLSGPVSALNLEGELRLTDVHRWDLLASSGEGWRVRYAGALDLVAHNVDVRTVASGAQPMPIALHVRATDFLARPACSVVAELRSAPLGDLLPLAVRMGVIVPENAKVRGSLGGAVSYSNAAGWAGAFQIADAEATLPNAPPLTAARLTVAVSNDRLHFDPAPVRVGRNDLLLGGDYVLSNRRAELSFSAEDASIAELQAAASLWFGSPAALSAFKEGQITGSFTYSANGSALTAAGDPEPPAWSGRFDFADARLLVPSIAAPLERARGRVSFNAANFELDRFTAALKGQLLRATYRYNLGARRPERLRVEMSTADAASLQAALRPADSGGLLSRLHLFRRTVPPWLAARNLEGDVLIRQLSAASRPLGAFAAHFLWQGAALEFGPASLKLNGSEITGAGNVNLASSSPRITLRAALSGYPWRNGIINAEANLQSPGIDADSLRNLVMGGSFTAENLALSEENTFDTASGLFQLSLASGWPDLRISALRATASDIEWTGQANTQPDGALIVDMTHEGRQLHIVSTLSGEEAQPAPAPASPGFFER